MFAEISEAMRARMRDLEQLDAKQRQQGLPPSQRFCQIPPETGRFLALLAAAAPPGLGVEVGTSAGYSTLWLALGRQGRGPRLQTLERLPWKIEVAQQTFRLAGVEAAIELHAGDALLHLEKWQDIAFCFLDAAKGEYLAYYEKILPRLQPAGILCADNILSHEQELAPFVAHVLGDPRVDALVVPIGKGVLVARKKAEPPAC